MDKKIIQKIGIIGDGLTGKLTTIALFRLGYPVEIIGKKALKSSASVASISISSDSFKFLKELKINNLEKICNPINTIKLYENHYNYLDPDSIFFNKTKKVPLSYIVLKDKLNKQLELEIEKQKINKVYNNKNYALTINTIANDIKVNNINMLGKVKAHICLPFCLPMPDYLRCVHNIFLTCLPERILTKGS